MVHIHSALLAALPVVLAQVDPPGTPFPNTTYSNATDPFFAAGAQSNQTSPPSYPSPWGTGLGDWADAYAQARSFVAQLTLAEKVNLTTGVGWESEKCVGNTGGIPRLGFKALCMEDSPLGIRFTDYNSAFPGGSTIAATWDRSLIWKRGYDMGTEHKLKGIDVQLGPVVGPLGRHPEGGRNWEGFAPDPVLSGIAVAETIKGMQAAGIMSCTKHYIGNEQEHFRQGSPPVSLGSNSLSSNIDDITMHELYLWPFADAVRAGTTSVMCSYQQVNNSQACQNSYLLNYLLKNELGFQGFVMSDWSAQHSGVSAALAGLDMTMPGDVAFDSGTSYWGANLTIAVLNGTVPQWRLDDMVVRIVAAWYYVDRASNQVPDAPNFSAWTLDTFGFQHIYAQERYQQVNYHVDVRGDHGADIREAAAKATVLLKNNGALPLTGKERLTAVFGSDAAENVWGPNGCPDRNCDNGTLAMGWGSGTANFPYLVTPVEAIKAEVLSNGGTFESVLDDYAYTQATALARRVPYVNGACIVFGNADSGEGYINVDGNVGDRNNLTLWHNTDTLIQNVTSMCNNTIVVMHTVGPVLVDAWYQNPNVTAILWAGLPGQESGNSLTDVLYGRVNPGAKSVFTWGSSRGSYGSSVLYEPNNGDNAPQDNFEEGVFIDYRAFDKFGETPIYEFGFGLSYTNFSFSNLKVQNYGIPEYTSATGQTPSAQTYGTVDNSSASYVYPTDFDRISVYIYPYLNSSDLSQSSGDADYGTNYSFPAGSYDSNPQPYLPAGSNVAPGGNQALYDVLFSVTADVKNTGSVVGDEVPQLYIALGGPNDPKVQLRGFDRLTIFPGQTVQFKSDITRRDISNWDPAAQNWYISNYTKTVYVGNSSRNLPLNATLSISGSSPCPAPSGYPSSSSPSGYPSQSSSSTPSGYSSPPGYQSSTTSSAPSPPGYQSSTASSSPSGYPNPSAYPSSSTGAQSSPSGYPSPPSYTKRSHPRGGYGGA